MTDDTTADDLQDQLDDHLDGLDTAELADDLDRSIDTLLSGIASDEAPAGMPFSPQQGLSLIRPAIKSKATQDPDAALQTLAVLHLETGALIDKHTDHDPTELAQQ